MHVASSPQGYTKSP